MPNLGGEYLSLSPGGIETSLAAPAGLRHEGRRAQSPRAALSIATAFLTEAATAGQPTLCFAPAERVATLRRSLRGRAQAVTWIDTDVLGRNPARLLSVMGEFVRSHDGERVRALGDLSWPRLAVPVREELFLHELLLASPACAAWSLELLCCYDVATLGSATVATLEELHQSSGAAEQLRAAVLADLPEPPSSARRFPADITTLAALREFVHAEAAAAGVDAERIDDLVYAVNEVVTNSICHGAGHADLSAWAEPTFFCCDVRDRGRITDPLAGRVSPLPGAANGRGLWLVHHLCDLVQVRSTPSGTTVRMRMDRAPARST